MELGRRLTQSVTLLMFCLGYQIGTLMTADRRSDRDEEEAEEPLFSISADEPGYFSIAVAGRGSLMWDWLRDCSDKRLYDFFKEGVRAAGAQWPKVEIRIVRDKDPKGTVGRGLLVKPTNLDMSDGWGELPNMDRLNEEMEDDNYYNKAAQDFINYYQSQFYDVKTEDLNLHSLSGYAQNARYTLNNTFKILMETIHDYLNPNPEL